MVKKELYMIRLDGVALYRTYSDSGKALLQVETGNVYDEAVDVENAAYTYEEVESEDIPKELSMINERKV